MAQDWQALYNTLAEQRDTDYYLFSAAIYEEQADKMIAAIRKVKNKRSNAGLIICTLGGNADSAYQIARTFKRRYKKFTLFVFGHCNSAGTLLAIGADEIVMKRDNLDH